MKWCDTITHNQIRNCVDKFQLIQFYLYTPIGALLAQLQGIQKTQAMVCVKGLPAVELIK